MRFKYAQFLKMDSKYILGITISKKNITACLTFLAVQEYKLDLANEKLFEWCCLMVLFINIVKQNRVYNVLVESLYLVFMNQYIFEQTTLVTMYLATEKNKYYINGIDVVKSTIIQESDTRVVHHMIYFKPFCDLLLNE